MSHAADPLHDGAGAGDQVAQVEQAVGSLHRQLWPDRSNPSAAEEQTALERENGELREAIDRRAVIEQAKGALMLRYGLDPNSAFGVLRDWSQETNIKLRTVADTLVNDVCSDGVRTPANPELADILAEKLRRLDDPDEG